MVDGMGQVMSGILNVIRNGLQWKDAPKDYGPNKTLYNRFIRWTGSGSSTVSSPTSPAKDPDRSDLIPENWIVRS